MPDDSPGFFRNLTSFANAYLETKTRKLQNAKPQTKVDSGGSQNRVSFAGQDISRSDLQDIKEIRESGGIITSAYDAKALMRFGTGVEFHAENPDLEEWLRSNLPNIDLTVLEMGEDATYYPYYVGESVKNRVGGFSHIEHIEPWTMLPITDEYGDIVGWEQELSGTRETEQFTNEEIGHIVLNKSSGRDKTGISDVLQNKEEIETFRANQQAMRRATERLGYPFVHAKAGREGAAQLNDNELRRIRNRLADIGPGETQVTGPDVDIELKEGGTVDFGAIQERDTRMLSTAIGIPLELLNEGSDGLGSGKPAEARLDMFALQNEAARRRFAAQFKSEFLVDIVREYSPFDHTQEFGIHIKPFLDDKTDVAELIQKVGDYMTANEVRSRLDMEPLEDDELGEGFQTPADEEAPEDEGGGLFGSAIDEKLDERGLGDTDFRGLQDVENIALDDYPEAAQENARMALDAREETGNPNDCLTSTGWAVANNLDSGDPISESQLESMSAFERFEEDKEQGEEGRADCGWMAWKAWGGDEGIEWADSKMDELEEARENSAVHNHAHSCGFHLSDVDLSGLEPWEKELSKLHKQIHTADSSKQLAGFSERSLPEFVVERLRGAILNGAIFSDIESVGANDLSEFRTFMAESLTEDGWTIDELTGELQEFQPDITDSRAESVIRTEAGNVIREAREDGYAENFDLDKERFYWVGSLDPDRTTLACQWLIAGDSQVSGAGFDTMGNFSGTNPNEGGEPVSLSRLKELIQEANKRDPELDHDARELTPHINCRKQWVRYVE